MTTTAKATARIDRPVREVERFATDPRLCLPLMSGFGRFRHLGDLPENHHQEWEVFLQVGSLQIGGAVDVDLTRRRHLMWSSLRGTRHRFDLAVEPVNGQTLLTLELTLSLRGLLMSRIAERLARNIMGRHLEAAAQELRHHIEWEMDREVRAGVTRLKR